ncbi:MAG: hypothetical protein QNJ81_12005 [Acidimicrobiia bacterium]|nr:hypothetical protein [Acidimicrobiia bacterium]
MNGKQGLETAVVIAFPWLLAGLATAVPLLAVPASSDRRWDLLIHLSILVAFSLALTWKVAATDRLVWFADRGWSGRIRFLATMASLVVIVTGATALVTLATTAALRFEPSLQYLQLLSALDIAWVVAGTTLAVRALWGRGLAVVAGVAMSIVCVLSIALYLAAVGLDPKGGWLVDGGEMLRLVLPFDVVAAMMTVTLLLLAARNQRIEQASAQS